MKTVNYQPEMGEVVYPAGLSDLLKGLSVDEQSRYFRTTLRSSYVKTDWLERTLESTRALENDSDVKALIVRDGCIVGAMIKEWTSDTEKPVLLDKCICTYYADDNNGAGYSERTDYTYFVAVPKNEES